MLSRDDILPIAFAVLAIGWGLHWSGFFPAYLTKMNLAIGGIVLGVVVLIERISD